MGVGLGGGFVGEHLPSVHPLDFVDFGVAIPITVTVGVVGSVTAAVGVAPRIVTVEVGMGIGPSHDERVSATRPTNRMAASNEVMDDIAMPGLCLGVILRCCEVGTTHLH